MNLLRIKPKQIKLKQIKLKQVKMQLIALLNQQNLWQQQSLLQLKASQRLRIVISYLEDLKINFLNQKARKNRNKKL